MTDRWLGSLRDKDRSHREIKRRAIEIETVSSRYHESDDAAWHTEALHILHRLGQSGFAAGRRKGDGERFTHRFQKLNDWYPCDNHDGAKDYDHENHQRQIK